MSTSPVNNPETKQHPANIATRVKITRVLALAGFFGTMAFLMLWIIKLAPPQIPKSIASKYKKIAANEAQKNNENTT